jgi:hypothetical protein
MTLKMTILPLIAAALFATATTKNTKTNVSLPEVAPIAKKVPGTPTVTNMVTCSGVTLGSVTVVDDQDLGTLTITFQVNTGWSLKETNVYAGTLAGIPVDCYGKIRPNLFPHRKTSFNTNSCSSSCRKGHGYDDDDHDDNDYHNHCGSSTQTYTLTIPLAGLPTDEIIMSVNAKVTKATGNKVDKSIWAQGAQAGNNGCAMRFSHVLEIR